MQRKLILGSLIGLMLTLGLAACGKRGDPYRPSEVPAASQNETPAGWLWPFRSNRHYVRFSP